MKPDGAILIAGGGIGGLTAALALLRRGVPVRVFEQSRELREVGAGLTLSQGAMRCLSDLGLEDAIEAMIARSNGFPFLHYRTGRLLAGAFAKDGPPAPVERFASGHVFRADLHTLLAQAVRAIDPDAIALGRRLERFEQDENGVRVTFVDGEAVAGSALIGCDGVRSKVRAGLLGAEAPDFTGRVAYRFLLPADEGRPFLGAGGTAAVFIGPGKTFNRYLISGGTILNCVGLSKSDTWAAEGWSHPATVDQLLAEFEGWHPDVRALMARAPTGSLIRWGIFQRQPLKTWTTGRVTLLGDAAHPMLPFLGLGAAMAIEDGVVLGKAVSRSSDLAAAFQLYEQARVPRTTRVFEGSRLQGEIFDTIDPEHYPPPNTPSHDPGFYRFDPDRAFADA